MEIFEEEKKENNRFTKILLVINLIIWTIILFMVILWNGVVNAATTTDVMDNFIIYKEGGTSQQGNDGASITTSGSVEAINFNFGNLEGNVSGQVQITFKYLTNRVGGMYLYVYTGGNLDTNASTSKSCQFTTNGNYYTAKCQFNFNTINETSKYTLLQVQFNPVNNILANIYTASGTAQITPTDLATSNDIQQQTISIIQNALGIATEQSQTIINESNSLGNRIETIMNSATNSIQESIINSYKHCEKIDKYYKGTDNKYLKGDGTLGDSSNYMTTDFISIKNATLEQLEYWPSNDSNLCFYNYDKVKIRCIQIVNIQNGNITINEGEVYIRVGIQKQNNKPQYKICQNDTDAIIENQNQNTSYILEYMNNNKLELEATFTHEDVNGDDLDDLEDIEDTLHTYTTTDMQVVDVGIDADTSSWVWNTLTSLLNTSSLVFGMVISILSIGIMKLILAR